MERRAVMTDIETRARDALNEVRGGNFWLADATRKNTYTIEAMCRQIEAHDSTKAEFEAFKRDVSDAVSAWHFNPGTWNVGKLKAFIIPKPDPLVEALKELEAYPTADELRAAIEKRGGKIVWGEG